MMFRQILWLTLLVGATLASDVVELTDADFEKKITEYPVALAEFFAPWCGHCKRLAPEYEKAATALKLEDLPVTLIKVDCTANTETCSKYGVSGYPTLKVFRNGEMSKDYAGGREADGIIKAMRTESGPSSRELKTDSDLTKFLENAEAVVVAYLSSASGKIKDVYHKVADGMKEELRFAHTGSDDLTKTNKDKVVVHRPKRLFNKFESDTVVCDATDASELKTCLSESVHGLVGHRTTGNAANFKGPLLTVYYDIDYQKNPKGSNYWRNRILKTVSSQIDKLKGKLNFAVSSVSEFAAELGEFGKDNADGKTPVATIRDDQQRKYVLSDKFSVESLEKFIDDFLGGQLEPYLKSEALPEDNSAGVKVVVGKNFDEIVNDESKDVLIEFYAPWCGHCKKLVPIYDELAEKLKGESEITIAKMDATANDVPSLFNVRGFPTIFFVPKGDKKNPKQYNGGREVADFLTYLAKESTNTLKGYDRDGKVVSGKDEL